jgi:hypothetical protein
LSFCDTHRLFRLSIAINTRRVENVSEVEHCEPLNEMLREPTIPEMLKHSMADAELLGFLMKPGWKGVWLKVREPDAEDVTPDYTITRLPELLKITEIADTA